MYKRQVTQAESFNQTASDAKAAHYKWNSQLGTAIYTGTEFQGSLDDTACILGRFLYGDLDTGDEAILALFDEIKPIHKEIHQSAAQAISLLPASPQEAEGLYTNHIQDKIGELEGLLDQVTALSVNRIEDGNQVMKQSVPVSYTHLHRLQRQRQ